MRNEMTKVVVEVVMGSTRRYSNLCQIWILAGKTGKEGLFLGLRIGRRTLRA